MSVADSAIGSRSAGVRLLRLAGSLKFALINLAALFVGVCVAYLSDSRTVWALVVPLASSAVNLLAAMLTNAVFRRQLPLLVFHLALLAVIVLVALGRLTYLKGAAEVVDGGSFDGVLATREAGPFHGDAIAALSFASHGFTIDYAPGIRRGATRNEVAFRNAAGRLETRIIGDQQPLVLAGYRFYTSHNKGFAPTFVWHPAAGGVPQLGAVHLPAYPLHEYRQAREWVIPGTATVVWTMLQFQEIILDPDKADQFKLPGEHDLVVRIGEQRWQLQPGMSVSLPAGRLEYVGLRGWMGYTVFYDWTIPWLLAAALAAAFSLGWHYWRKFAARPWNREQDDGTTA
ncbi:MAG: cytochrome c biogenesis protein ResB [Rhodocyclales bacterium]|nr:cytochrome c biogenesis protein ResB [Rhodocyclales bacterium]